MCQDQEACSDHALYAWKYVFVPKVESASYCIIWLQSHSAALQSFAQLQVRSGTFKFAENNVSMYFRTQSCARKEALVRCVFVAGRFNNMYEKRSDFWTRLSISKPFNKLPQSGRWEGIIKRMFLSWNIFLCKRYIKIFSHYHLWSVWWHGWEGKCRAP